MRTLSPVKSSNVAALGFDATSGTLTVQYKGGGTYAYHGVSPLHYAQMMAQDASIGGYLHTHIKPHHKASKVEGD